MKKHFILLIALLLLPLSEVEAYHIFVIDDGGGDYQRLSWDPDVFTTDNSDVCISGDSANCAGCSRCAHDGGSYSVPNDDSLGLLFVIDNTSGANNCDDVSPYQSSGSDPYVSVFNSLAEWSSTSTTAINLSYVCSFTDITLTAFDSTNDGGAPDPDIVVNGVPVLNGLNEIVFDTTGDILNELGLDPDSVLGLGVPLDANGDSILLGSMINPISEVFILINQTPAMSGVPLEGTLVHEIGHTLGLAHSGTVLNARGIRGGVGVPTTLNNGSTPTTTANAPTMFWAFLADDGNDASLDVDDLAAATIIYPNGSASTLGSISGTVLASNGGPILGATVIAYGTSGPLEGKEVGVILGANPDLSGNETGDYLIEGVPPGTYRVTLIPLLCDDLSADTCRLNIDSYLGDVVEVLDLDFPQLYYNGATLESFSQTITVTAGNDTPNIDFFAVSTGSGSTGGGFGGGISQFLQLDSNSGACTATAGIPFTASFLDWMILLAPLALWRWGRRIR